MGHHRKVTRPVMKIQDRLERLALNRDLVQITRRIKGADRLEGFFVAVGQRWLLLHLVTPHGFHLDGYTALRTADLRSSKPWGGKKNGFPGRALAYFEQSPVLPDGIDLTTTKTLIETAAERWPMVTIHVEVDDPQVCFIGKPLAVTSRTLRLLEITPAAKWDSEPTGYRLRNITRIDFGGRYEEVLHAVGRRAAERRLDGAI
jgi:hypothetical protein